MAKIPRQLMKLVRRTHMYLGLVLFPWVIFFGLSGILFNHPNAGEDMEKRFVPQAELQALIGLAPMDATVLAHQVVEQLAQRTGAKLRLDPDYDTELVGWSLFQAAAPEGRHVIILDLEAGDARIGTRRGAPSPELAPFSGTTVEVPDYTATDVHERVKKLLPALNIPAAGPVVTNLKAAPELRFRLLDESGRAWNTSYNLGTTAIEARAVDTPPRLGFVETLARLHTTHHYPVSIDPTFYWALFADLTGITLIIWALTGLVMWWQMKPKRTIGVAAVSAGALITAAVFAGVIDHLTFGNESKPTGPGPEPPRFSSPPQTAGDGARPGD